MSEPIGDVRRRLLFHGALLLLFALVIGFANPLFPHRRLGVSAHMEGLLNAFLLLILALVWADLRLGPRARTLAYRLIVYAAYGNTAFTLLGAVWGTGRLTPVAAGGSSGQPWQEAIVMVGLVTVVLSVFMGAVLMVLGFRPSKADTSRRPS